MNVLISGALHEDRLRYAQNLAMSWLCQNVQKNQACKICRHCQRVFDKCHPNITYIEPESNEQDENNSDASMRSEIKIEQVRRVIAENQKANFEEGLALFIITHTHQLTKAAANALLKSIEESGEKKAFLCLAPSRSSILPTIASRLISLPIKPSPLSLTTTQSTTELISTLTKTRPMQRFKLCEHFYTSRNELLVQLETLREECHTLLRISCTTDTTRGLSPQLVLHISGALEDASTLLERNGNPRLVIEQLVLHNWPHA